MITMVNEGGELITKDFDLLTGRLVHVDEKKKILKIVGDITNIGYYLHCENLLVDLKKKTMHNLLALRGKIVQVSHKKGIIPFARKIKTN